MAGHVLGMHVPPRRPAASWPAALLPGALLVALITTGAATATSGGAPVGAPADRPITELHVVRGR